MKRIFNFSFWGVMLTVAICATACSNEVATPKLPEKIEILCDAGDRPTFEFTASHDWQLSSDAMWCKFITSAGELQDMSGHAGTHTITLKVTNEGIKDEPTFAHITIKMGDMSDVLVTVERGANRLSMHIYDVTDTPIKAIELGYVDWIPFRIEANFRFAATDFPEWVEFGVKEDGNIVSGAITGVPGEQTEAYARIVNNGERECQIITPEDGYVVTFSDESGNNTFTFPIVYNGMGSDDLSFVTPTDDTYGWEVSLDGKVFRQRDEVANTDTTFNEHLEFSIAARNNEYAVLLIEKVIERGIPSYDFNATWMSFDHDKMQLTVAACDSTRYGIVMVLPNGIYDVIRDDLSSNILELDDSAGIELPTIKYDYMKYILIEFTQCDFAERGEYEGLYIYHSLTTLEIPATKIDDSALKAEYGVEEVYSAPFVNSIENKIPGIIIDPRIENWNTATFEEGKASATVTYKGEPLKISENEYYMGENKDEIMSLHLWGPNEEFTENVYIVFKVDGIGKKLLVVTPPAK